MTPMAIFHADFAARSVPRYTSYPTAAEFADDIGAGDFTDALDAVQPADRVSLYVHVPYCHEICWYCGCNTGAVGRSSRLDHYVDALIAEIGLVGRRMRGRVAHVHFGGGSPNALPPDLFARVAAAIRTHFSVDADAEWAAELDPRHIDADFCRTLVCCGVTRVSIGAQTFDLRVQARINRLQPFRLVARSVAALREAGIAHLNLDLMYGLVGDRAHLDEAQAGARLRLADRRGIGGVVLLAADIGLHISRRHHLHVMPQRRQRAAPVMRRAACLHPDPARRQRCEERKDLTPPKRPVDDNRALGVDAMNLKNVLGQIEANDRDTRRIER